ncbi:MAG: hypothetical protein FWE29_02080 [Defluviitaleaceae bacterium]|nr:hypothetical protein [Defluviitaleaceae bacterium]
MTSLKSFLSRLPKAALIYGACWVLILILGVLSGISLADMLSDALRRFGMWGILVLSMIPTIKAGIGPNFALPVGVCCGLFAMVNTIELRFPGWGGATNQYAAWIEFLIASIGSALFFALALGYIVGIVMNAVKGFEMAVALLIGFATTFYFSIIWLTHSNSSAYLHVFGSGLRSVINLSHFGVDGIFDDSLRFSLIGVEIRTGTLFVVLIACFFMWLLFQSRAGAFISSGTNESRVAACVISTILAAFGTIVYSQGLILADIGFSSNIQDIGFIVLYDSPLMMAFPAVAAILIGGAGINNAKIIHVIVGTLILQGLIANGTMVFDNMLDMTNARGWIVIDSTNHAILMLAQNAIILCALIKYSVAPPIK